MFSSIIIDEINNRYEFINGVLIKIYWNTGEISVFKETLERYSKIIGA